MNSGIYRIKNILNGKFYIGSAKSFSRRWKSHKDKLRKNKHENKYLQNAWNKYGEQIFIFLVLEYVKNKKNLISVEQCYLDSLQPFKTIGYNICRIAGSRLGTKATKKTKRKISKANKGRRHTEETKEKIRKSHLGKHLTEQTKKKLSKIKKGVKTGPLSYKTRKKMSEARRGNKSYNFGKQLSRQTRKKISIERKGKCIGEDHPHSKLTWDKIHEIRIKYVPYKYSATKLAKEYKVSQSTIQNIITNKIWIEKQGEENVS